MSDKDAQGWQEMQRLLRLHGWTRGPGAEWRPPDACPVCEPPRCKLRLELEMDEPDRDALFSRAEAAAAQRDLRREAPGWLAKAEAGEQGAFNEDRTFVIDEDPDDGPVGVAGPFTIGAAWDASPDPQDN